jgi:hypothetical protein
MLSLINKMITNKLKKIVVLSSFLATLFILFSSSVYADSQNYSITCTFNSPAGTSDQSPTPMSDSQGNVSCGQNVTGFTASITHTGADATNDTSDSDTVLTVDCGNDQVKSYNAGEAITQFTCQGGTTPTVTTLSTSTSGSGDCSGSDSQSQALCSHCNNDVPEKGCVNTENDDSAVTCNGTGQCNLIAKYLNPFIDMLSILFAFIAVISFILGGINFASSEGDPQKASRAKQRIFNTVVAVVAYMFLYAFLEFLIPGGIFH